MALSLLFRTPPVLRPLSSLAPLSFRRIQASTLLAQRRMSSKPNPTLEPPNTAPYFKELWANASRPVKIVLITGLSIMSVAETVFYGKMLWVKMGWGGREEPEGAKEEA